MGRKKQIWNQDTKRFETMENDMDTMRILSDALADAEAQAGTVTGAMIRIRNQERKAAVIEAIRYELVNRLNGRIANGTAAPGERPRPPLPCRADSMRNARRHAALMADEALS